ncbi:hypothetical protein D3C85_1621320 [compost metagenome]
MLLLHKGPSIFLPSLYLMQLLFQLNLHLLRSIHRQQLARRVHREHHGALRFQLERVAPACCRIGHFDRRVDAELRDEDEQRAAIEAQLPSVNARQLSAFYPRQLTLNAS